jgi:hypothetical protein
MFTRFHKKSCIFQSLNIFCGLFFFTRGEEYNNHTKCISEEEKYSGKNYVPKAGANKGEQKQNQWVEVHNKMYGQQGALTAQRPTKGTETESMGGGTDPEAYYYTREPFRANRSAVRSPFQLFRANHSAFHSAFHWCSSTLQGLYIIKCMANRERLLLRGQQRGQQNL